MPPPQPSGAGPHWMFWSAQLSLVQVGGGCDSSQTGDARSKNMNSSALSCGLMVVDLHSLGNDCPLSPDDTWMSLKMKRPHWLAGAIPTGVLNVMYSVE